MQPVIAKALTDLGITVQSIATSGDSWDELDKIMADGSYDLLMWAQNVLPAGDPLQFLNKFFRSDGGMVKTTSRSLNSSTIDGLLDALSVEEQHAARVTASKAAMAAILAEVPVSNLVTPFWHVGLSKRMSDYDPWGADYYIIRPDFHEAIKEPTTPCVEKSVDSGAKQAGSDFVSFLVAALAVLAVVVA